MGSRIPLQVYATVDDPRMPLRDIPAHAQRAERLGFTGLFVPEAVHDGFLAAMLALEHTRTLRVATSVVLAFPRSPTTVAYAAWDLQALSGGRFELGLGSQVRGNIERRFSVEWKPPVARMRDYVGALRAIWKSWQTGSDLKFVSEYYHIDRMQPFFRPGPIEHPGIPVFLGAVNPRMTALAGEVADGLMTHPTNTSPLTLRERTIPALESGARRVGRAPAEAKILASTFVASGPTSEAVESERGKLREYLGFLYSTPQYWPALELHGWGDVGRRLHDLSRQGHWDQMKRLITDEILEEFVASGSYEQIGPVLRRRYSGLVAAITLRMPEDAEDDGQLTQLIEQLRAES
jgi:probable F420-dependent oxidoreductase